MEYRLPGCSVVLAYSINSFKSGLDRLRRAKTGFLHGRLRLLSPMATLFQRCGKGKLFAVKVRFSDSLVHYLPFSDFKEQEIL